jgi:hypothetical protein
MKLICLLSPTLLLLVVAVVGAQETTISGRELTTRGLRGNRTYSIFVELTGPTKALGLSAAQVAEQVRARLRQAGIVIDPETDGAIHPPRLHVQLDAVGPTPEGWYGFTVWAVVQDSLVKSGPCLTPRPCEVFLGDSWNESKTFLASGELNIRQEVRLQVDQLLDRFVNDHLEMNAQGQSLKK